VNVAPGFLPGQRAPEGGDVSSRRHEHERHPATINATIAARTRKKAIPFISLVSVAGGDTSSIGHAADEP
jgi:hypothetical protein